MDSSGNLDFSEFCSLMDKYFNLSMQPCNGLMSTYRLLSSENDGIVTVGKMRSLIEEYNMDETWSSDEMKELFAGYQDEEILNFNDFVFMITGEYELRENLNATRGSSFR